ncbi:MAG: biotin/lipoyl-binding protein, partial [Oscillospiraceae bacterium]
MKIIENIKAKLFGSKKNTAITLIVLAVALVGGIYLKGKLAKPAMEQMGTRTVEIKKSSITDVVTGSGSVKSKSVVNVTTSLTYKVKEILVQVGDTVKKGDIIAKLDNAEILKSINAEKTRLGELKKTAQENYDKSITEKNRSYDRAIASENEYNAAKKAFDEANALFSKAQSSISQKQKEYDEAYKKSVTVGIEFNNLTTEKLKAEEKIKALTAKETQAQSDYDNATDPADKAAKDLVLKAVQAEKAAAENSLVTITGKLTQKDGENKTAKADCATKEGELTAAKAACNFTALEANYTAAKATMDGARATFDGNEKSY